MTILNQNLFIAKGAERECYINPQDKSKIVKIQYCNNINRNQNNLDIYYYNYLKTKNISYKHISKYYQEIQTNLGQGIVFESILDYNDIYSKAFEDII
ncbi:MAG: hypothetical protein KAJ49_09200, partial [Arcobacteraceae bacterium]|nr:hypothetical protein [Arcobacteraceae bacterium]